MDSVPFIAPQGSFSESEYLAKLSTKAIKVQLGTKSRLVCFKQVGRKKSGGARAHRMK